MKQHKRSRTLQVGGFVAAVAFAGSAVVAGAQTTSYRYDARGRLIGSTVSKSGGAVVTDITYDKADNRSRYAVSGSSTSGSGGSNGDGNAGASVPPGSGAAGRFIVVPLNGFTVIPIN